MIGFLLSLLNPGNSSLRRRSSCRRRKVSAQLKFSIFKRHMLFWARLLASPFGCEERRRSGTIDRRSRSVYATLFCIFCSMHFLKCRIPIIYLILLTTLLLVSVKTCLLTGLCFRELFHTASSEVARLTCSSEPVVTTSV